MYPVGSIYITTSSINPESVFGGKWERYANGRCLIGIDTNQSEFNVLNKVGGVKNISINHNHTIFHTHSTSNHTLTESELPAHSGHVNPWLSGRGEFGESEKQSGYLHPSGQRDPNNQTGFDIYFGNEAIPRCQKRGGNKAHNHGNTGGASTSNSGTTNLTRTTLPPYICVYIWRRIS